MPTKKPKPGRNQAQRPGLLRRLAAIMYDGLLLLAVLFLATALLLPFNGGQAFTSQQFFFPFYLLGISFFFYAWFWTHGGQTLGLKAWKVKLQTFDRQALSWQQAAYRFFGALLAWSCGGLGFIWMLFDKNGYTWHDYWSNSTLYFDDADSSTPPSHTNSSNRIKRHRKH